MKNETARLYTIYTPYPETHRDMPQHGIHELRGAHVPLTAQNQSGSRFGRMFPFLPPFEPSKRLIETLGEMGGIMDEGPQTMELSNPDITAGYTFLGQFIDHDITLDMTSIQERQNDPMAMRNFRTPALSLDCVYDSGPEASPFLYDQNDPDKFLIGTGDNPMDLPRNSQGTALICDPRNDENLVLSQLHTLMMCFHNNVVDSLRDSGAAPRNLFCTAQQTVRWHYQWIVSNEYLPMLIGQSRCQEILLEGRDFYQGMDDAYIPIEFSGAAFRFGHSQVKSQYTINDNLVDIPLFELGGFSPILSNSNVDWSYFFNCNDMPQRAQASNRIDAQIANILFDLPFIPMNDEKSLVKRNLLRGSSFGLPSGQAVAKFMGMAAMDESDLEMPGDVPLWYYILKEADVQEAGLRLGDVGGTIVGEVLFGLMQCDKTSYHCIDPNWEPTLADASGNLSGQFCMADLITFAEQD